MDQTFFSLVGINVIAFSVYTIPIFLLPVQSQQRNISQTSTGLVFAIFSIGQIIVSLYIGKIMLNFGKKKLLYTGFNILSFSMFMFGICAYIFNSYIFLFVGFASRFMQGMANGVLETIVFGYIPICYPQDIARIIGIFEFTIAFSMAFGGQLGLLFEQFFGYQLAFYIFAAIILISKYPILKSLPDDETIPETPSVNYSDFLKSYEFNLMLSAAFLTVFGQQFILSTLVVHIQSFSQQEQNYKQIAMSGHSVAQAITMLYLIRYYAHDFNGKKMIKIGLFVFATSFIFIGLLRFGIIYTIFGLYLSGIGFGLLFYPLVPEMQKVGQSLNIGDKTKVNDACSAFFVCSLAAGGFMGPALGGFLCDTLGHKFTCLVVTKLYIKLFVLMFINDRKKNQQLNENQIELIQYNKP